MHVDPKAPGDSPFHPSNVASQDETPDATWQPTAEEWEELRATHMTRSEREHDEVPPEDVQLDHLGFRRDILVDYLTDRASNPDVAAPIILDWHSVAHQLQVSEDGTQASWEPVDLENVAGEEVTADSADDYESRTVAELTEILKGRELPHSGVKAELVARLREADAAKDDTEDQSETEDDMDAALAALDAVKGSK
ncbi:MAG: hypothetical protein K0R68_213 [Mycobacterium sp.]|jgi:hypothetical protein|nr:hypothetical protein [Mycobacterium sp.]